MKPAPELHVEWVEDEAVVLDPDSGELHYLNTQAALVLALIQEHGLTEAKQVLAAQFPDVPNRDEEVDAVIADMVEKGILIDD